MSEPIPESVPTSHDRNSSRPTKKRALTPTSAQSSQISALFANPDRALSPSNPKARVPNAPPEIVANVQGSSAGAGSGEFHVYKASRRREYERLRTMDEEKEKEEQDAIFEAEREEKLKKDQEKTGKNRARREKAKMRQAKTKQGTGNGYEGMGVDGKVNEKAKLKPNVPASATNGGSVGSKDHENGDEEVGNAEEIGIVIHDDD